MALERPHLHFAHANGFPIGSYRQFLDPLQAAVDVSCTDFIGHHPDYPVTDNWFYLCDHLLHDVEAAVQRSGKPVLGVGHSLGGGLMFMSSLRRPELFESVTLLDVPLITFWEATVFALLKRTPWRDRFTPAGRASRRRSEWPSRQAAYDYMRQRELFARFPDSVLWDYIKAVLEQLPATEQVNSTDEKAQTGWTLRYLPEVEAEIFRTYPTNWVRRYRHHHPGLSVVIGEDTDLVRPHHVHLMRHRLGIPVNEARGGHLFPLEHPQASAEQLLRLLGVSAAEAEPDYG